MPVAAVLAETVSLSQFMTAEQRMDGFLRLGTLDISGALSAALAAADEVVLPAGTYKAGKLSLAGPTGAYKLRTKGSVTLMMYGLGVADDAITCVGHNYKGAVIEGDLIVDMQWTGRDGLKVFAGDAPSFSRITFRNVPRDCIQMFAVDFNWIENGRFHRVVGENIGRNMLAAYTGGAQGAFINEMVFDQCELRGCAQKVSGGTAVYASAGGAEGMGAKMSEWTFIDCNFDAQRGKSVAAGFDIGASPVRLAFNDTGSGKGSIYESWKFIGGGWESTSGVPLQTQGLFYSEPGTGVQQNVCRGWHITGITPGSWGNGSFTGVFDDYFDHNKQFGTVRAPLMNEGWSQVTIAASATANIDINLPLVHIPVAGRIKGMDVFELSLFYQQYTGAGFGVYRSRLYVTYQVSGTDQYTIHEDNERSALGGFFSINGISLLNKTGGTTINIANLPKTLRASVTTSATWASGGGDNLMYALLKHVGRTHGEFPSQYF
jgi:hypothetical protein